MNPIDASEARASLKKKGFELKQNDHEFYYYYHLGKKTSWRVKISHGTKQLIQREIRGNAKVLSMTGEQLRGVLECSLDADWIKTHYTAQNPETATAYWGTFRPEPQPGSAHFTVRAGYS